MALISNTPHDALFKPFLMHPDTARDFLDIHLPAEIRGSAIWIRCVWNRVTLFMVQREHTDQPQVFYRELANRLPQEGSMMTLAEWFEEQGMQKGVQEGMQKGGLKGKREGLQEGKTEERAYYRPPYAGERNDA